MEARNPAHPDRPTTTRIEVRQEDKVVRQLGEALARAGRIRSGRDVNDLLGWLEQRGY